MPVLLVFAGQPGAGNGALMIVPLRGFLHLVPLKLQPLVLEPFALGGVIGRFRVKLAQFHVEFFEGRFRDGLFDGGIPASYNFQSTPVKGERWVEHPFPRIGFGQRLNDFYVLWAVNQERLKVVDDRVIRRNRRDRFRLLFERRERQGDDGSHGLVRSMVVACRGHLLRDVPGEDSLKRAQHHSIFRSSFDIE